MPMLEKYLCDLLGVNVKVVRAFSDRYNGLFWTVKFYFTDNPITDIVRQILCEVSKNNKYRLSSGLIIHSWKDKTSETDKDSVDGHASVADSVTDQVSVTDQISVTEQEYFMCIPWSDVPRLNINSKHQDAIKHIQEIISDPLGKTQNVTSVIPLYKKGCWMIRFHFLNRSSNAARKMIADISNKGKHKMYGKHIFLDGLMVYKWHEKPIQVPPLCISDCLNFSVFSPSTVSVGSPISSKQSDYSDC